MILFAKDMFRTFKRPIRMLRAVLNNRVKTLNFLELSDFPCEGFQISLNVTDCEIFQMGRGQEATNIFCSIRNHSVMQNWNFQTPIHEILLGCDLSVTI